MDPRRAIFRLWTDVKFEAKRKLVEEYLRCGHLDKAINETNSTGFKCGVCNEYRTMIKPDIVWTIATCPEKYLYEGKVIVCSVCMGVLADEGEMIMVATRLGSDERLYLDLCIPQRTFRYVYNTLHNYYIIIGHFPISPCTMKFKYDVIFRSKYPTRNPFFHIDNTLFTILGNTLLKH
jgi:hypothetical protein